MSDSPEPSLTDQLTRKLDDLRSEVADCEAGFEAIKRVNQGLSVRYLAELLKRAQDTITRQGARIGELESETKRLNERLDKAGAAVKSLRDYVIVNTPHREETGHE
ncbi:MAG: hypothetical protein AAF663_04390 [Planctomycetota bacterium]